MQLFKENYDVVVAGGGIAGTMAAISSAREGKKTLLIERYAALGGMATLGLVQPITMWGINNQYVISGTGKKILEEMTQSSPNSSTGMNYYGPTCDAEFLKFKLEQLCKTYKVDLLYHSFISNVDKDSNIIKQVRIHAKGGEYCIRGKVFIDATGDADLSAYAGIPYTIGSQGMSMMFIMSGIDRDKVPPLNEVAEFWKTKKPWYYGAAIFWHPREDTAYFNATEVDKHDALNPIDLTHATLTCREQAWYLLETFRALPGFENAYIEQTAPALGVRESRRITGVYTLTGNDIFSEKEFDDTIARASCPIDVHGDMDKKEGKYQKLTKSYPIPYRTLITEQMDNLVVTGRCISADHQAHSSLRRMAPGFAIGEASGIAAALAVEETNVRTISTHCLQKKILEYGGVLEPETTCNISFGLGS